MPNIGKIEERELLKFQSLGADDTTATAAIEDWRLMSSWASCPLDILVLGSGEVTSGIRDAQAPCLRMTAETLPIPEDKSRALNGTKCLKFHGAHKLQLRLLFTNNFAHELEGALSRLRPL